MSRWNTILIYQGECPFKNTISFRLSKYFTWAWRSRPHFLDKWFRSYPHINRPHNLTLPTHQLFAMNRERVYPCESGRSIATGLLWPPVTVDNNYSISAMTSNLHNRTLSNKFAFWIMSFLLARSSIRALWAKIILQDQLPNLRLWQLNLGFPIRGQSLI